MPDITTKKDEDKKPRVLLLGAGFTLIEMLIVMMVFGIVAAALVGIFLRSIKAGSKADAIAEVKENGDYALGVMERVLRNAEEVTTCGGSSISYVMPKSLGGGSGSFGRNNGQIVHGTDALTSNDLTLENLSFGCSDKLVTVSFTLKKGETGGVKDPRTFAEVEFRGSVRLREY